jgi:ADP-ribosylglycohydrolase
LIGAIAGDIIGSVYEFGRTKSKEFPLFGPDSHFTDDTGMTVAIAQAILTDGDYRKAVLDFGRVFQFMAPLARPDRILDLTPRNPFGVLIKLLLAARRERLIPGGGECEN